MKHKLHYNEEIANELLNNFSRLTGFNLQSRKRKPEDAYIRCLFYKILNEINGMNDRMIAEFFEAKGRKTNRVSIYQSLTKVQTYYTGFKRFRQLYDVYFLDQKELDIKRDERGMDALEVFISNVKFEKRAEILELVTLRVKSWEWKAQNKYEIIEGSGNLAGTW